MKDAQVNPFRLLTTQATEVNLKATEAVPGNDLKLDFKHKIFANTDTAKRIFIVSFKIRVNNTAQTFVLNATYQVSFQCDNEITTDYLKSSIIQINAPAIAFPFLRSFVTTVTANAGYPAIYLPSINFVRLLGQPEKS